jgi:branched-chain amino acid transport system substrate-binding protein
MYRVRQIIAVAILSIVVLTSGDASSQVKIGATVPMTGPLAPWGNEILRGASLAVETINAQGGIKGNKIEFIAKDDNCLPDRAVELVRELIFRENVDALIGSPCAGAALASSLPAAQADKLMIGLSSVSTLTGKDRPILRVVGSDDKLARMAADYVAANFPGKAAGAWLAPAPTSLSLALRAALERRSVAPKQVDMTSAPDASLPAWTDQVDVLIVGPSAANTIERTPSIAPTTVIVTPVVQESMAPLLGRPHVVLIANPGADFFEGATAIVRRAGAERPEASGYIIYAFAAVQLFAEIAKQAGGNFQGHVLANLAKSATVKTLIGPLSFDDNGDLRNWRFAAYGFSSGPNVCKTPQCKQYDTCPSDCPK